MNPKSDDPFDVQTLSFAEAVTQLALKFLDAGADPGAVMTATVLVGCNMAESWDKKEVLADMLELYVADLRSGIPMFPESGPRA